jgi:hypothetical protein
VYTGDVPGDAGALRACEAISRTVQRRVVLARAHPDTTIILHTSHRTGGLGTQFAPAQQSTSNAQPPPN